MCGKLAAGLLEPLRQLFFFLQGVTDFAGGFSVENG